MPSNEGGINTEIISRHDISGYSYAITSPYFPTEFRSYRGQGAGVEFVQNILKEGNRLNIIIKEANAEMIYGEKEKQAHAN